MSDKMCPIWDHKCYGQDCMSWDENHDRCTLLFAAELGLHCSSWNCQPYRQQDIRY